MDLDGLEEPGVLAEPAGVDLDTLLTAAGLGHETRRRLQTRRGSLPL